MDAEPPSRPFHAALPGRTTKIRGKRRVPSPLPKSLKHASLQPGRLRPREPPGGPCRRTGGPNVLPQKELRASTTRAIAAESRCPGGNVDTIGLIAKVYVEAAPFANCRGRRGMRAFEVYHSAAVEAIRGCNAVNGARVTTGKDRQYPYGWGGMCPGISAPHPSPMGGPAAPFGKPSVAGAGPTTRMAEAV